MEVEGRKSLNGCGLLEQDHRFALKLMNDMEQLLAPLGEERMGGGFGWSGQGSSEAFWNFLTRALPLHIRQEEEVLFPVLMKHIGEGGPLEVMHYEHLELLTLIQHITGSPESNPVATFNRHVGTVNRVIELLRLHIQKEEMVLFPLVRERLSESDQRRLAERLDLGRSICF